MTILLIYGFYRMWCEPKWLGAPIHARSMADAIERAKERIGEPTQRRLFR